MISRRSVLIAGGTATTFREALEAIRWLADHQSDPVLRFADAPPIPRPLRRPVEMGISV
jgi:hypothetical protein